ncbi:hypothetical protein PHLGIDRAFT_107152 [Phlebiopsis gigantea 11061_1 CR5-6]|uniref:aspartate--tRNA ligase n=1 Tax=Phlebiopsis gigantea (strain 11061_1 CR5-6) TaxID=745531 RepID=A0A0C3NMP6_PHLG1|nr:hypothetical protein PHLGIDRAFT_107152 [Phlebiopsis gigantea 11061_1 CR5-6]
MRDSRKQSRMSTLISHIRSRSVANKTPEPQPNGVVSNGITHDDTVHSHEIVRPNTQRRLSMTEEKENRKQERELREERDAEQRRREHLEAWKNDPCRDNYGDLPLNQSQSRHYLPIPYADEREDDDSKVPSGIKNTHHMPLMPLADLANLNSGDRVAFRARVHHIRPLGSKIVFIVFRSQQTTLQGILVETEGTISQTMVRWAEGLNRETIVRVEGVLQEPPKDQGQEEVHSASIHHVEVRIEKVHVISKPTYALPFQVADISRPHELQEEIGHRVGERTRFANRVLDLRSPASQAIFRIRAAVCELWREALLQRGFLEIQSSKFQGGGTESGAAVFKVDYFRRPAFLAQSPQLAKQMCIAADMERVFEIGPVFRAENSNTHRHLTEFTGLDIEMAFENHYHEVLNVIDDTLKTIFKGLQERFRKEIETVKTVFPHEDLIVLDETPRIRHADGIRMLKEAGWREEDGTELTEDDDLSTAAERKLGALMKEKYGCDYYILDKFPLEVRPFYTMPDPENPKFSNSFDIFVRGEEILSGGQRIHDAAMLEERMHEAGVDPDTMSDYVNGFRWGCPPHGGGGVGLERIVMLFLQLGDVCWASLLPRDPKSFSTAGVDPAEASMAAAQKLVLNGPASRTFTPGTTRGELPPLENLIARYGDATNTSWVDPAWTVWRDASTGAAVGYIPSGQFAVVFGNPLCEPPQIRRVVKAFLAYLRSDAVGLKPIWCCVDKDTEQHLAEELGWSAIIAVAEERVNPVEVNPENDDKTVRRKIHRAEREGVKVHEVVGEPDEELRAKIEERCQEWAENRKGTQIHLTGVRPFDDIKHRRYYYATDGDGKICSLVVLAQLAPIHGFQIKWALEFPGAPLGAVEYIVAYVIRKLGEAGVRSATFGAGAASRLQGVDNVGGFRIKTLEKTYNGISSTFHLTSKGDFRGKFGIEQEPMYICYPKGSLGVRGIEAIMSVLQKPK